MARRRLVHYSWVRDFVHVLFVVYIVVLAWQITTNILAHIYSLALRVVPDFSAEAFLIRAVCPKLLWSASLRTHHTETRHTC